MWARIDKQGGRIVKTTGDGLLLEFPSVVAAVECSIAVQKGMVERNIDAGDQAIRFRIGVHLGDVIVEADDIFGDGINIAARLQEICDPNGVTISSNAHDSVEGRVDAGFADGGEQKLKNIVRPVRVWRWSPGPDATSEAAKLPLPLPDKPSIAVLPFDNMSGDPEQEYFSDGITEDIITALSRVGWFFVIARNSSFTFKGRPVEIKQVARELGVRYVLEGSVRKSGDRLRVTAQLLDASSGNHIWADRYDGQLIDVFDFQDQVTASVVAAIEPKLRQSEIERALNKRSDNLDAYDFLLRALQHLSIVSKERYEKARALIDAALEIDPDYGQALSYAAWCRAFSVFFNWSEVEENDRKDGLAMARRAIEVDPEDATTLRMVANVIAILSRDHETARGHIDKSLKYDPNSPFGWACRGWINVWDENPEDAKQDFEKALRLSPLDPWAFHFANGMTFALVGLGEYEAALPWARQAARDMPGWIATQRGLALTHGHLGNTEEAAEAAKRILEIDPDFTISRFEKSSPFIGGPVQQRLFDGLRKAGVPE
jgi:adenylate cyclase